MVGKGWLQGDAITLTIDHCLDAELPTMTSRSNLLHIN